MEPADGSGKQTQKDGNAQHQKRGPVRSLGWKGFGENRGQGEGIPFPQRQGIQAWGFQVFGIRIGSGKKEESIGEEFGRNLGCGTVLRSGLGRQGRVLFLAGGKEQVLEGTTTKNRVRVDRHFAP